VAVEEVAAEAVVEEVAEMVWASALELVSGCCRHHRRYMP
jgi:hypothetical protein